MKPILALLLISLSTLAAAADTEDPNFQAVFDREKGRIYALYGRELRDNPKLAGKIVFNVDIATSGEVTGCRVQSSNVRAPDFEKKLCERIRQMKFAPRPDAITATKTLEFVSAM
jgi:TonB family protein